MSAAENLDDDEPTGRWEKIRFMGITLKPPPPEHRNPDLTPNFETTLTERESRRRRDR